MIYILLPNRKLWIDDKQTRIRKNSKLDLTEKNYENLVKALTDNAIYIQLRLPPSPPPPISHHH